MAEKKAPEETTRKTEKKNAPQELNLDDLDVVQGGNLGNVQYTKTTSISADTRSKI